MLDSCCITYHHLPWLSTSIDCYTYEMLQYLIYMALHLKLHFDLVHDRWLMVLDQYPLTLVPWLLTFECRRWGLLEYSIAHNNLEKSFWASLVHRLILTHSDSFWLILIHSDSFWPILTHSDSFWLILTHSHSFALILIHSDSFWLILTHSYSVLLILTPIMTPIQTTILSHDVSFLLMMIHFDYSDSFWHILTHSDSFWLVLTRSDSFWLVIAKEWMPGEFQARMYI